MPSDEELASRVQTGDEAALTELMVRYEPKLFRYGSRFLGKQPADALSQAVQDIFIKVYENIEGFDVSQRFSPWIYRIAHNVFIDILRHTKRQLFYGFEFDAIIPHAAHAEDSFVREKESEEMRVLVEKGMDQLAPREREIITLFYFENLAYKDIADVLHIPINTVGVRLARARKVLEKFLPDSSHLPL